MKVNNIDLDWNLNDLVGFNDNLPYLNSYFSQGKLSLILGAGASKAINLPGWQELIDDLLAKCHLPAIPPNSSNFVLKVSADSIKSKLGTSDLYLDYVTASLYKNVTFDFKTASKELLIGLSSLIVNKKNGRINEIVSYNFDSVLEWYLELFGLDIDIVSPNNAIRKQSDVTIFHIHGYLPHPNANFERFDIIFSQEEFEDRVFDLDQGFWKLNQQNLLNSKIFLSIGLSPKSIKEDLCPIIRKIDKLNEYNGIIRKCPYGYALISKPTKNNEEFDNLIKNISEHAIVPIIIDRDSIPEALLKISSYKQS